MKCSGIEEALGTIYGTNTVDHIMSGKAISRALQGHFLIESALTTKLLRNFFPDDQVKDSSDKEHLEIQDNEEELDE